MKNNESAKSAKRPKNASEKKKDDKARKIQKILKELKGTRNIPSIKSVKKRIFTTKVKNKKGETIKTRRGIPNVFAKFYEDLYEGEGEYTGRETELHTEEDGKELEQDNFIKEFTSNGIRAEQLKNCSDDTKEKIRTIFNEIAQQDDFTPKSWRKIRIQVIYKKR